MWFTVAVARLPEGYVQIMSLDMRSYEATLPILAAATAVVNENKVLLIKRADFYCWAFPGGFVEAGESVEGAAVRETKEETGIMVESLGLLGIYSRPRWRKAGVHHITFLTKPVHGEPTESEESLAVGYFGKDELPPTLFPWYRQRVLDALQPESMPFLRIQDVEWFTADEAEIFRRSLNELREERIPEALRAIWLRWEQQSSRRH